ncbi:MAG: hypothetical protein QM778_38435 [Myxococcales bacterium]
MIGRSTWLIAAFVSVLWTLWVGVVPEVRADAKDEARILFEAGVAASRSERWLEASEYFRRSLTLAEKPSTWFNLAVAEIKQGHGTAGLSALDAFERSANPRDHAEMLGRVPALRKQAEALPEPEAVPDTETEPRAEAPAREVPPSGPPSEEAKPAQAEPSPLPTAPKPANLGPPRRLLAVGVVTLAASAVMFGWWRGRVSKREKCEADLARCTNLSDLQSEERATLGVGIGLAAVSVGLIAAGATWLVREKSDAKLALDPQLDVTRRTAALRLRYRF